MSICINIFMSCSKALILPNQIGSKRLLGLLVSDKTYTLSPDQALQLMAISVMLKDGELSLQGDDAELAYNAICDCGEEIALQVDLA